MAFGHGTIFSKIMQTKHHSKVFSEGNLILARVVKQSILL